MIAKDFIVFKNGVFVCGIEKPKIHEILFKKHKHKTAIEIKSFFRHFNIPKLSEDISNLCKEDLTEKDFYATLKSKQNDKFQVTLV